jgi:hypothetical protein
MLVDVTSESGAPTREAPGAGDQLHTAYEAAVFDKTISEVDGSWNKLDSDHRTRRVHNTQPNCPECRDCVIQAIIWVDDEASRRVGLFGDHLLSRP